MLLLELPAEIRLKILRNLMKSANGLQAVSCYPDFDPEAYKRGEAGMCNIDISKATTLGKREVQEACQLSAQLRRCCKQLRDEGSHVLYTENPLEVVLQTDWDQSLWSPRIAGQIIAAVFDKLYRLEEPEDMKHVSTMSQGFTCLHFTFWNSVKHEIKDICWHIRAMCIGKDLPITAPIARDNDGPAFRDLRCQQVKFSEESQQEHEEGDASKLICEKTKSIIQSQLGH